MLTVQHNVQHEFKLSTYAHEICTESKYLYCRGYENHVDGTFYALIMARIVQIFVTIIVFLYQFGNNKKQDPNVEIVLPFSFF